MGETLSVYRNCSMGGIVSVMRERIGVCRGLGIASDFYFLEDFGGGGSLSSAGARHVHIGRSSHDNNVLTLVSERRYGLVSLFSNYGLGRQLQALGSVVHAEVHGSHDSSVRELREARGHYDRIVVPSLWSRDWLVSEGFSGSDIAVVPNMVDRSVFHPGPDGPAAPAEVRDILWVGRLEEHKNWRDALYIFALLRRRGVPVRPVMILSLHSDPSRVHDFLRQVTLLGLMDRLVIHYNLSQPQVAETLRQAASGGGCSLITSRLESFGLAASESVACRLPVVAPRVGALPERVRDGETGLLFEFGERERAADLIGTLLFDGAVRERIDRCLHATDPARDGDGAQAFRDLLPLQAGR